MILIDEKNGFLRVELSDEDNAYIEKIREERLKKLSEESLYDANERIQAEKISDVEFRTARTLLRITDELSKALELAHARYETLYQQVKQTLSEHNTGHSPCNCVELTRVLSRSENIER